MIEVDIDDGRAMATSSGVTPAVVEIEIEIKQPQSRIAVRARDRELGRAEAVVGERNWAAKHYWTEGAASARVTVYEFDEALPAGRVRLRIPTSAG